MVAVRYPCAEGRDGERIAGGLEGLWIVAVRPALTSCARRSRSVRQVRDSPACPVFLRPRSILCKAAALLHLPPLCAEKLEFSRSCTQFRHIALIGGHFDVQDDPGNIARSGGFAIRCVIVPSDAERGMAQTTGAGRQCSWPAAPDYQGTWYFQRASPPAPRGAADLWLAARAGHRGGEPAHGWRGDLPARYRITRRFAQELPTGPAARRSHGRNPVVSQEEGCWGSGGSVERRFSVSGNPSLLHHGGE